MSNSASGPGRKPLISFLSTVYRTEGFLPEMIDSVREQTSPDWELVIVDNGRSDAVVDVVDRYGVDPRIRLVRQENRGYRGGVTAAAQTARGQYLSVLDSDDRIMPGFVSSMAAFLRVNPVAAVGCDATQFDDATGMILPAGYLESVGVRWRSRYAQQGLRLGDVLAGVVPYYTGVVSREAWHDVGGYAAADEDADESVVIWLSLVQSYDVRLIDARLGWYRIRDDSLSRDPARVEAFERSLIAAFTRAVPSAGSATDRRAVRRTVGRLRFHQELRRARRALLDGDASSARRHARRAFVVRPRPRSALVVASLALSPQLLRRVHPYKQRFGSALARSRTRLSARQ